MADDGSLPASACKQGHGLCVWRLEWHQQLRRCSMCGGPSYCCTACQLGHWEAAHREECAQEGYRDVVRSLPQLPRRIILQFACAKLPRCRRDW